MNSIIEDPGIPLVNRHNGGYHRYTSEENVSASEKDLEKYSKFANVGYRLAQRKKFFRIRRIAADICFAFAMLGILIMMIENELYMQSVFSKADAGSYVMKVFLTLSTMCLIAALCGYHYVDLRVYMVDNGMDNWRLAVTSTKVGKLALEALICLIHPLPGDFQVYWETVDKTGHTKYVQVPFDVLFSIPMFLRLYLLCRVMLLHSKLYTDASAQSLGALNRINFTFNFIFKSYMSMHPTVTLFIIMVGGCLIASWSIRACETSMSGDDVIVSTFDYGNSLWMVCITFLTVGYGDVTPTTSCGRAISVFTGLFGAGCTALVVAVLARKVELSRAEKYVHNFVIDVELDKKMKHAAANVLREGWLVFKLKKRGHESRVLRHQKKLLKAIRTIRKIKTELRRMEDGAITLIEMSKMQSDIYDTVHEVKSFQINVDDRVAKLEETLTAMDDKLEALCDIFKQA